MRLLAPGAAVRMSQQAKQLEQLLEMAGAATMEEILAQIQEAKKEKRAKETDAGEKEGYYYGQSGDVLWDGVWDFDSEEAFERELRKIGMAGEKFAFETICARFSSWQEVMRTAVKAVFYLPEKDIRAVVDYPDTDTYK